MTKVKSTEASNSSSGSGSKSSAEGHKGKGGSGGDKPPPMVQSSSSKASAAKKGSVRCQACKKKVGIACRYQCRCGLTFCSTHRYPEAHECTFDYKTEGRNKLRENNPVIVAPKIQEI